MSAPASARFDVAKKKLDSALLPLGDGGEEGSFAAPLFGPAPAAASPVDIPGDTTTPRTLEVGGSWSDAIDVVNDEDWFRVWLVQGVTYRISLVGSDATPLGDPVVRLLSSTGIQIAINDDIDPNTNLNSLLNFTPTTTGTYFISAEAFGASTGEYTLELTETDVEPVPTVANDIPGTATTAVVAPDGFVRGSLDNIEIYDPLLDQFYTRFDDDWYRVEVQAGQEYNFLWARAGATGATGVDITLYDTFGNVMWVWENPGTWDSSYINWFPYSSGTWFIGVSSADTSGEYTIGVNHITNSPVEAITGATALRASRVDVYFAQAGETFGDTTSEGWNAFEIAQAMAALGEFSKIANLTFSRTMVQADAEFTLVLDDNELGAEDIAGRFGLPGGAGEGIGSFQGNYAGWSTTVGGAKAGEAIDRGGYGWDTMLHEFGHGVGLVHPHDDLFGSTIMDGVGDSEDHGDFDLNQGIYTVMSYNSGWEKAPHGEPTKPDGKLDARYGWSGTLAAFDIAVIQQKYGANLSYHTGNDVYTLPTVNQSGTFYSCIWDAGGIDTIRAGVTSVGCTIDLRAAPLLYGEGGGGLVSYHTGIHGGFTVANGVLIENATGGAGNDQITGNTAGNILNGGAGDDWLRGGFGNDSLLGGAGIDTAVFAGARAGYAITNLGGGNVRVVGADGNDVLSSVEKLTFGNLTLNWPQTASDFNADAFGDVLWRNSVNGQIRTWELNGAGGSAVDNYGAAGVAWQQVAADDFNGDGRGDILFRNTASGQVATWELNGAGGFTFEGYGSASLAWQAVGSGDFNADGKGDVLFRNASTGQVSTWELNGAGGFSFDSYGSTSAAWKIAAIGDFNADGRDDILWRNSTTGQVATWELNGAGGFSFDSYGAASLAWHIFGVGDFNADGRDDILFRNNNGQVSTWELNGAGGFSVDIYGSAGPAWSIMHATDTNSDGKDDILWRNTTTGQVAAWELNGAGGFSFEGYGSNTLDWQIFDGNFQFV